MKRFRGTRFLVIVFAVLFLLSSCSGGKNAEKPELDEHTNSTYYAEIQYEEKTNLMELIMKDGVLILGDNLEWLMSKQDFLSNTYRSDVLDPDSDNYEEHRNNEMPNGMISLSPPTAVQIKDLDFTATTTYMFDVDEALVTVAYRAQYSSEEIDMYSQLLEDLIQTVNENEQLRIGAQTFQNVSDVDLMETPITIQWDSLDGETFFRMSSEHFQGHLILGLIVSLNDTM